MDAARQHLKCAQPSLVPRLGSPMTSRYSYLAPRYSSAYSA